jgi:SAM-dependent methyltransferase
MKLDKLWQALNGDHYARHYILYKFMRLFKNKEDDFYWNIYTHHYRGEMEELAENYTLLLKKDDYAFDLRGILLQKNSNIKPLHHHWRLLYETIAQLKPKAVLEVGCGNGMNLHNIHVLMPEVSLFGIDRSQDQIDYLREINPGLPAEIRIWDVGNPFPKDFFPFQIDVCYTQAVIMHIKEGDKHRKALVNMFNVAAKQVVLLENWLHHDFMQDILSLHAQKAIRWDNMYLYYRAPDTPAHGNPHALVCSAVPLDYPLLTDYSVLRRTCDKY